jgi:hypothetical protein
MPRNYIRTEEQSNDFLFLWQQSILRNLRLDHLRDRSEVSHPHSNQHVLLARRVSVHKLPLHYSAHMCWAENLVGTSVDLPDD